MNPPLTVVEVTQNRSKLIDADGKMVCTLVLNEDAQAIADVVNTVSQVDWGRPMKDEDQEAAG